MMNVTACSDSVRHLSTALARVFGVTGFASLGRKMAGNPAWRFCTQCGQSLRDTWRFCAGCGVPLPLQVADEPPKKRVRFADPVAPPSAADASDRGREKRLGLGETALDRIATGLRFTPIRPALPPLNLGLQAPFTVGLGKAGRGRGISASAFDPARRSGGSAFPCRPAPLILLSEPLPTPSRPTTAPPPQLVKAAAAAKAPPQGELASGTAAAAAVQATAAPATAVEDADEEDAWGDWFADDDCSWWTEGDGWTTMHW